MSSGIIALQGGEDVNDTEAFVTQNFSIEYHQGVSDPVVAAISQNQDFDLVLFLEPDVDWIDDGTRNLGEEKTREKFSGRLKKSLIDHGVKFETISGNYEQRFAKSIELSRRLMED